MATAPRRMGGSMGQSERGRRAPIGPIASPRSHWSDRLTGGGLRWGLTATTDQWSGAARGGGAGGGQWARGMGGPGRGAPEAERVGGKWWAARNRSGAVRTESAARRARTRLAGPSPRARREHVVRQLDRIKDEELYSDLYLRASKGTNDSSKVIVFGFKGVSPPLPPHFPPAGGASSTPAIP